MQTPETCSFFFYSHHMKIDKQHRMRYVFIDHTQMNRTERKEEEKIVKPKYTVDSTILVFLSVSRSRRNRK